MPKVAKLYRDTLPLNEFVRIVNFLGCKIKTNINQLSKLLNTTSANLYSKLKCDNFSQNELEEIAKALDVKYESCFIIQETNERI